MAYLPVPVGVKAQQAAALLQAHCTNQQLQKGLFQDMLGLHRR
jgi:hypothetical protein